jgi:hypothetical protein
MRKGYRRKAGSEGSAEQMCELMDKNRILRRERWTSGRLVAKSIFIKDAKRRFGNCARKATELTPGGLLRVPTSELRASQGALTADAEVSRGHIRPSSRQG